MVTWKPTRTYGPLGLPSSYELVHPTRRAELRRVEAGKAVTWELVADGVVHRLGRRASFGDAEAILFL